MWLFYSITTHVKKITIFLEITWNITRLREGKPARMLHPQFPCISFREVRRMLAIPYRENYLINHRSTLRRDNSTTILYGTLPFLRDSLKLSSKVYCIRRRRFMWPCWIDRTKYNVNANDVSIATHSNILSLLILLSLNNK